MEPWAGGLLGPFFLHGGVLALKFCSVSDIYMVKWPGRLLGCTPGRSSGLSGRSLGSLE